MSVYTLRHNGDGSYACNMSWHVLRDGVEVKRGPEWACRLYIAQSVGRSPNVWQMIEGVS